MRIQSLDVQQFGALHERRFATDSDFVVVHGRNEQGKSSFMQALRTALFGFSVPSAARHPLTQWGAGPPEKGSSESGAALELGAVALVRGERVHVERRLERGAQMRLALAGEPLTSQPWVRSNAPLPQASALSAKFFDAVYTIDPDAVRAVGADLHPEVKALLTGGTGLAGLPSVAELLRSIEAERSALRRDDRRSKKTVVARIDAELAELRAKNREIRRMEIGLLELERSLHEGRSALAELEAELAATRRELRTLRLIERAALIQRQGEVEGVHLEELETQSNLSPPGPLLADLEDAEIALEEPAARLALPAKDVALEEQRILRVRGPIEALKDEEASAAAAQRRVSELREVAKDKRSSAEELERSVRPGASEPLTQEGLAALRSMSLDRELGASGHGPDRPVEPGPGLGAWIGAAAGGGVWLLDGGWAESALAAAGPWILAGRSELRKRRAARCAGARPSSAAEGSRRQVEAYGVHAAFAATSDELKRAVETLERSASLLEEAAGMEARADREESSAAAAHERWSALFTALHPEESQAGWTEAAAIPTRLREQLAAALDCEREAQVDARERASAERQWEAASARLRDLERRFEATRSALERAVPGEPKLELAYERVERARAAQQAARGALRELQKESGWDEAAAHPRYAEALRSGSFEAAELRRLFERAEELTQLVADRKDALARLDERLAHERPESTASEIESAMARLQVARREALERHAQLTALAAAMREGDRKFQTEHQPGILKTASRMLETITGGRYRHLTFEAEGSVLSVYSREAEAQVPCEPPLSRGVREQIHLALRLGVAELSESGGDPLPLLLDEALVHWDDRRRREFYGVLRGQSLLGRGRQVFLFTCHGELAREASEGLGALEIEL